MRKLLLVTVFIFPAYLFARPSLQLYVTQCKTDPIDRSFAISVFKNDTLFGKLIFFGESLDTTIHNLEYGTYKFQVLSLFNEQISDSITITKDSSYWKPLCVDDFKNYSGNFKGYLDSLQNGDFYTIQYDAYGCFHWETQIVKIFKKDNNLFCTLYGVRKRRTKKQLSSRPITVLLTQSRFDHFLNFQIDLYKNATGSPGSTEMTFYTIEFKKCKLKFNDAEEGRQRFLDMRKNVFGK